MPRPKPAGLGISATVGRDIDSSKSPWNQDNNAWKTPDLNKPGPTSTPLPFGDDLRKPKPKGPLGFNPAEHRPFQPRGQRPLNPSEHKPFVPRNKK